MLINKRFVILLILIISLFVIDTACSYKENVPQPILYDRAVMNIGYTTVDVAIKSYSVEGYRFHIIDVDGNGYYISQNNCTLINKVR